MKVIFSLPQGHMKFYEGDSISRAVVFEVFSVLKFHFSNLKQSFQVFTKENFKPKVRKNQNNKGRSLRDQEQLKHRVRQAYRDGDHDEHPKKRSVERISGDVTVMKLSRI